MESGSVLGLFSGLTARRCKSRFARHVKLCRRSAWAASLPNCAIQLSFEVVLPRLQLQRPRLRLSQPVPKLAFERIKVWRVGNSTGIPAGFRISELAGLFPRIF